MKLDEPILIRDLIKICNFFNAYRNHANHVYSNLCKEHHVKYNIDDIDDVGPLIAWCETNCLNPWNFNSVAFYFESEVDATLFALTGN